MNKMVTDRLILVAVVHLFTPLVRGNPVSVLYSDCNAGTILKLALGM